MATKPKATPSTTEKAKPVEVVVEEEVKEIPETTQEREDALKERLAALGNEKEETEKVEEVVVEDLLSKETPVVVEAEKPAPPPAKLEKKASTKDNKSALLVSPPNTATIESLGYIRNHPPKLSSILLKEFIS